MATSGTYAFSPAVVDIVLDAFERINIRPAAITPDHMFSARRSINLTMVRWSNRGINLWAVDEQSIPLNANQGLYNLPSSTVTMLETWIRSYQLGSLQSVAPAVNTTIGSATVELSLAGLGVQFGSWISIPIYIAAGGLIVQGYYQVTSVTGANSFTISAGSAATSTEVSGGAVPQYWTTAGSTAVTVTLTAHGFAGGETYTVHVATEVGGIVLQGDYTIQSIPDANNLVITAASAAGSDDSAYENGGDMQIAVQNLSVTPQDRIMMPISRTDWAAIPNKTQTGGYPTSYWFDRTTPVPTVNIWQPPNGTLVQELRYFRMRQLQDADPQGTQTPDIPYRFEEALCAELAYMLAIKWLPDRAEALLSYSKEVWAEAASEDRERVVLNVMPMAGGYWS